ncbi:hypothetical protein ACFFU9_03490 [Mariniflexile ostreae]|uniref:Transmembrane protein n=1 Tax=Mariniflexile ostreae TaxID=1520892 RepID=A0ABV5F8N1_9FLAO
MVKKVFSVWMALLFLLTTSQQALVMVHFKLNQQSITQKFCVNKENPELQCHGNCHLKKELESTSQNNSQKNITYKICDLDLVSSFEFVLEIPKFVRFRNGIAYQDHQHSEPYLEIFVPPPLIRLI